MELCSCRSDEAAPREDFAGSGQHPDEADKKEYTSAASSIDHLARLSASKLTCSGLMGLCASEAHLFWIICAGLDELKNGFWAKLLNRMGSWRRGTANGNSTRAAGACGRN
ncbi:hypothetical protein RvY_02461 [Ramazzottius varieornatus]|uniref:Uncharacterized protein n=1 Tax=Ramazzottius varieornatus TaxID=947166 RepID=A0A1D1URV3_RAMVA|nr:hypothetical protein RvY_02461 [Ramazzottius varieornatus]